MLLPSLLSSSSARASLATGAIATVQSAASGAIVVPSWLYTLLAVVLALTGVYLARLVTIDAENKRLGRVQTLRETGPLTWIGVLLVCPFIWHFNIAIPYASMMGLGVGYAVRILLKILGDGAAGAARAMVRQAAQQLDPAAPAPAPVAPPLDAPGAIGGAVILPPDRPVPADDALLDQLGHIPDTPPTPPGQRRLPPRR